ncbi:MAG TPA: tRNA (N6-isopentenyl adenosine(37)-C2)-methylthiotransferase MiaB [Thermodesulfovibrionales bacterium]|nr:tRNA (N6-isopentenyl adenosine(37)-C2)-methylthiotransferase MiaB [Thermodesulfovibrionales bacterium]
MSRKVYIHTFGCQMNVHDSEKMLGILEEEGFVSTPHPREADLIIFNTCSIRQKAEQKFFSELGRIKSYKRFNPLLRIAVAGCIAQQEGKAIFKRAPYVDFVFGPQNILSLRHFVSDGRSSVATEENPGIAEEVLPVRRSPGISAWVTIMYGCNNFCSYCVVPYTRGRERSRPSEHILSEVSALSEQGFGEITLLGQNVNSYKSDVGFPELLGRLDRIGGIKRIRFVTSHPKDLSPGLINAIAELPKVCEHIHLPLQSGSTRILTKMNRRYSFEEYLEKVNALRARIPDIAITTDIIAGFPGETSDDHKSTLRALSEIEFDGIFAFMFSPRPRTKAAGMRGHLPEETRTGRLLEILSLQDSITERKNASLQGSVMQVLAEGPAESGNGNLTGRTRTNKIVDFTAHEKMAGQQLKVAILRGRKHSLEGKIVD